MKKRLICMVLVVIAALVMAACSSKNSENTDNNAPAGGNKTENVTEAPTPAEENKTDNITEAPTPAEENKTDNITEAPTPAEENKTDNITEAPTPAEENNKETVTEAPNQSETGEGNFTLTNFIGSWLAEDDGVVIVIDAFYNWQIMDENGVFCTGHLYADYGKAELRKTDEIFYCSLTYVDKYVEDEFGKKYVYNGPVEEYIPGGFVELITDTDQAELTLVPGRYYDISTFDEYVEITEDLSFEMWGYAENDFVCLNTGYLEKKDAAGVYIVHSESVYVDEVIEPFEIFMTEEGVIDWNGFIFCYSE